MTTRLVAALAIASLAFGGFACGLLKSKEKDKKPETIRGVTGIQSTDGAILPATLLAPACEQVAKIMKAKSCTLDAEYPKTVEQCVQSFDEYWQKTTSSSDRDDQRYAMKRTLRGCLPPALDCDDVRTCFALMWEGLTD